MKSLKTYIKEEEENFQIKLINDLCGSVGSGTKAAGVYESWVHIVTSISTGTRPTVAQVNTAKKHSEFHVEGKNWLDKIKFGTAKPNFADEKVLEAIDYIGGDIKDSSMPSLNWGSVDIIHNTIGKNYYDKLPAVWKTEKTKQNTADIIIITEGKQKQLSAALPDKTQPDSIGWDDKGKCFIPDPNDPTNADGTLKSAGKLEWYQVSLKKGIDDARIGKLSTYMNGKYSKFTTNVANLPTQVNASVIERGNYLGVSYGFDDRIDQILLDEGLFDAFKGIVNKVKGSIVKLVKWASGKLRKLVGGAVKLARKVMSSNPVMDNANKILDLANVSSKKLDEEFLVEKTAEPIKFKTDKSRMSSIDAWKVLKKQLSSGMINKEYKKIQPLVDKLNARKADKFKKDKKDAVIFQTTSAAGELKEGEFGTLVDVIIRNLEDDKKDWTRIISYDEDNFI